MGLESMQVTYASPSVLVHAAYVPGNEEDTIARAAAASRLASFQSRY